MALAAQAAVSTRHLSFVETGRSRPSRALLAELCEHLEIPLRERNRIHLAAGYAPPHAHEQMSSPPMKAINEAIERILYGHLPYPAVVIDQGWELVAANEAAYDLMDTAAGDLLEPPVNVARLSLHPRGLAPQILNLDEWHGALLNRLKQELRHTGDERLAELITEISGYRTVASAAARDAQFASLVVPLCVRHRERELCFVTTTTVFGTPREVTVSELAIEAFYPADAETRAAMQQLRG